MVQNLQYCNFCYEHILHLVMFQMLSVETSNDIR